MIVLNFIFKRTKNVKKIVLTLGDLENAMSLKVLE